MKLEVIEQYLEDMRLSWAPSTMRSEGPRLRRLAQAIDGEPRRLLAALEGGGAYTRVTAWTRVIALWDWALEHKLVEGSTNPYRSFRKKRGNLFRNAYQKRLPTTNYEQAEVAIKSKLQGPCRDRALLLLQTGMRWSEAATLSAQGQVQGKGGKVRKVYLGSQPATPFPYSYQTFRRALKAATGLRPHDLRKLALSRLVAVGASPFELAEIAGWASVDTAQSYIKVASNRLEALAQKAWKGTGND